MMSLQQKTPIAIAYSDFFTPKFLLFYTNFIHQNFSGIDLILIF